VAAITIPNIAIAMREGRDLSNLAIFAIGHEARYRASINEPIADDGRALAAPKLAGCPSLAL
jgi:hypothetical protein